MDIQEDITNYITGIFHIYPLTPREQLESMVILHYDISDAKAKELVGLSLIKALEIYRREEKSKENELRQVKDRIDAFTFSHIRLVAFSY